MGGVHHGRCFPALLRAYRQTQRRVNDKKKLFALVYAKVFVYQVYKIFFFLL